MAERKLKVATCSLAGCFGCHMSLLDIDERLFELVKLVEFDRSPITDIKHCGPCDIGIVEGGVCNAENVHVLREFRDELPDPGGDGRLRHHRRRPGAAQQRRPVGLLPRGLPVRARDERRLIPNDPELPLPFDKVRPINEVVRIDYFLPGCPPPADAIWKFLTDLAGGREPKLDYDLLHYD